MKMRLNPVLILACLVSAALSAEAAPDGDSAELIALVEISEGDTNKYEIDPETGHLTLSRVMAMPVVYPVNYGMFPGTMAADGDPLDALVVARTPILPGVRVRVRPVGVLRMIDGGEQDDKILCVPVEEVDPAYAGVHSIKDLPGSELSRIEAFFRVYKDLPAGRKKVELNGFGDADEAKEIVAAATAR